MNCSQLYLTDSEIHIKCATQKAFLHYVSPCPKWISLAPLALLKASFLSFSDILRVSASLKQKSIPQQSFLQKSCSKLVF